MDQIGRQGCVFTIGYGTEHDPDMLHGIANAGGGLFYYIENKDNIPDSFCDCLGGLLSVAAQVIIYTHIYMPGAHENTDMCIYTHMPTQEY